MEKWKCFVGSEHTFYGIYCDYADDVGKHWAADSTKRKNFLRYCNQIIPHLRNHDETPIRAYTREDYEAIIDALARRGQAAEGQPYQPYKESTLQDFRRLIYYVVAAAAKNGECDNVLWESDLNPDVTAGSEEAKAKKALLSKSLTVQQEIAVAEALLSNPLQHGQNMGLLLMYALGLRNAEACAVNFGDIKPLQTHPECMAAWIYKTTGYDSNALKIGGKTRNADRIIPLPDKIVTIIKLRRQHIEEQLGADVDDYPIACVEENWNMRCNARQLTAAARILFQQIKMEAAQLAVIDEDMRESSVSADDQPLEDTADPTAYLFRRNFGTHLHILGLNEAEIAYIIGHDIEDPYETRNEFVNEEKLYQIKLKLDQRPLVNTHVSSRPFVKLDCGVVQLINESTKLSVPVDNAQINIQLAAVEPTDPVHIHISTHPQNLSIVQACVFYATPTEHDRVINLKTQYHDIYCSTH